MTFGIPSLGIAVFVLVDLVDYLMGEKKAHQISIKEDPIGKPHALLFLILSHDTSVSLKSFKNLAIDCKFFFLEGRILIYVRAVLTILTVFCLSGLELQCNLSLCK